MVLNHWVLVKNKYVRIEVGNKQVFRWIRKWVWLGFVLAILRFLL
jgi:hypothetical protein